MRIVAYWMVVVLSSLALMLLWWLYDSFSFFPFSLRSLLSCECLMHENVGCLVALMAYHQKICCFECFWTLFFSLSFAYFYFIFWHVFNLLKQRIVFRASYFSNLLLSLLLIFRLKWDCHLSAYISINIKISIKNQYPNAHLAWYLSGQKNPGKSEMYRRIVR